MTDGSNSPVQAAPGRQSPRVIGWGAVVGIAPALAGTVCVSLKSDFSLQLTVVLLIVAVSLWPLAAVVLAGARPTRRFGLGMLLGVGLGWLAMLAVCGGSQFHL